SSPMYLTQGLHRSLRHHPDDPVTICGERVRSFAEHADRVVRLAGGLRIFGVRDGDWVVVLSLNSDRYAELLYAIPWVDAIVNPVNIRWSPDEIVYSLMDSETSVLVVDDAFAPLVEQLADRHPGLGQVVHAGDGPTPDRTVAYEDLIA